MQITGTVTMYGRTTASSTSTTLTATSTSIWSM